MNQSSELIGILAYLKPGTNKVQLDREEVCTVRSYKKCRASISVDWYFLDRIEREIYFMLSGRLDLLMDGYDVTRVFFFTGFLRLVPRFALLQIRISRANAFQDNLCVFAEQVGLLYFLNLIDSSMIFKFLLNRLWTV